MRGHVAIKGYGDCVHGADQLNVAQQTLDNAGI